MTMSTIILLVLHIAVAATAFGISLGGPASLRRARAAGTEVFRHAVAEANRRGKIGGICGVLTLLTGLALIFNGGGFGAVGVNIHIALAVLLVMLGLGFGMLKPAGGKLAGLVGQGDKDAEIDALLGRLAAGSGVMQLLWLTVLALMFLKS